jgi:sortase A
VRYGERKPNLPNRIVRIAAPSIKLDTSVYEVYVKNGAWEVAEYAAGHHYNSLNPGEGGNIVLSGHNNWKGEVFRYLEFLKPGDEITLWTLEGKQHKYVVQEIKKLKEAGVSYQQRLKNAEVMKPTPYERLTLITCWPYTTYTHRLIVIATPAP